ncbi:MAG: Acetyl-CoA:Cys-GlcN-Ins acetyltransferase, mycothiol synthase MshD [uncultured Blastococcus sp.]|uniref:Mycothiol acetyltransferase n=1 Tax=uncultured Blastococcus sp. TaxID=217144 RepID=A0A6J4I8Z8_9ACTN|nr:MAG: Acetyl-CoA:Cys-GlcN-Ins acetyltransferase, mycothiol synthase MshD [uncultured Blastococcus sp.]
MSDSPDVPDVLALLHTAAAADGVHPVSEVAVLRLQHGGAEGSDLVVHDDGELAGYARYDDGVAELVVHPRHRRRGVGTTLLRQLLDLAGDRPLSIWAHGDLPGSAELLAPHGFTRARVLLQLRRDLAGVDPEPRPALPDGVTVHPFRPGRDEAAWLRVNASAFATHPEQGNWTADDLRLREAEPWFHPDGFLLAWRGDPDDGGVLLGSHWTKVHPPGDVGDEAVGEVYVLAVDPDAQGMRLGRALTDLGLAHLRSRGLAEVLLYVEEDNAVAVRLYEGRGFRRFSVDVSWRHQPD